MKFQLKLWFGIIVTSLIGFSLIPRASARSNLTDDYDTLFLTVTIISVIVAALVIGLWVYLIYKFREGEEVDRTPMPHATARKLELTWTLVAILIIVFLMIFSYPVLFTIDDDNENLIPDETILVEGTGFWSWEFYDEDGTKRSNSSIINLGDGYAGWTNTLTIQVDRVYKFIFFTNADFIHSFFVPGLNFKMDVTPGFNNSFTIEVLETGSFEILCTEFCGFGHSGMRGLIEVIP